MAVGLGLVFGTVSGIVISLLVDFPFIYTVLSSVQSSGM